MSQGRTMWAFGLHERSPCNDKVAKKIKFMDKSAKLN